MAQQSETIRLLMVDDEEQFLESAASVLERRGIDVIKAFDGETALKLAHKEKPQVVLLDVKMPGIDGIQVFRELRKKQPGLPIIILTGYGSIPQAFEAAKSGVFDYLTKPCDLEALAEKVKAAAKTFHQTETGDAGAQMKNGMGQIRILLVDDEAEIIDSLKTVLQRRNLNVYASLSGREALIMLENNLIDVVVLDIRMPGMDGLETLKHIKKNFSTVEVILLTGHPDVSSALEGVKLGAREYIIKPPDIEELAETIKRAYNYRMTEIERLQEEAIQKIILHNPNM